MADSKITALTALTAADPANDMIPIVDVSDTPPASGNTKRISINNILACSPSATLASATITGDLTVDTSTLYVSSSADKVGIGTTSLSNEKLTVAGNISANAWLGRSNISAPAGDCSIFRSADNTLGFGIASSTAMTLNSTGLGVGGSVLAKISAYLTSTATYNSAAAGDDTDFQISRVNNSTVSGQSSTIALNSSSDNGASVARVYLACVQESNGSYASSFTVKTRNSAGTNAERFRIDSSGNVGIGVAPSAWAAAVKALQIGAAGTASYDGTNYDISSNRYLASGGTSTYITTGFATMARQVSGQHLWYTAPSGTAGTAITFTQAMTLAANGQLLLGTSTTDGAIDIGMVLNKPSATGFVGNSYQLNGSSKAFTYISSATAAFRVDTVTGYTINMISATNGVYLANGGTSWTALSDERFKDIIEPISNAVAKVGSIRSVIGKFKTESEGTRRSFLIAQDVQAVLPEAVDASNPDQLGVAYTEVIPLLVAAIKELTTRVQTLEAK